MSDTIHLKLFSKKTTYISSLLFYPETICKKKKIFKVALKVELIENEVSRCDALRDVLSSQTKPQLIVAKSSIKATRR